MSQNIEFQTTFENNKNATATYHDAIAFYKKLSDLDRIQFSEHGSTDSGYPLHTIVLANDGDFKPEEVRKKGKLVLLINNAIHPGEPCGVDASMMLARDYLTTKSLRKYLDKITIVIIPFYNIGGGLNRGGHSRANQNGPEAYGFRGNAQNLDLNRDFIKCDSRNAKTFNQIYSYWNPDVFIDNHTSNGADYQYTMTLIPTQHNKMDPKLASYMNDQLLPKLYDNMAMQNWEMCPYVYARETPDDGIAAFLDLPRYSSGYAALFNSISFMPETHMLKPYEDRVMSTYAFMDVMIKEMYDNGDKLSKARKEAIQNTKSKKVFDINWSMDTEKQDKIMFKGYEAGKKPSDISGLPRLFYDRSKPYEKEIPYMRYYKTTKQVERPVAYIIPQAYQEIIDRLEWNGIKYTRLKEDHIMNLEMYTIQDFETKKTAYEGHYQHSNTTVEKKIQQWQYYKGDYIVMVDQPGNKYLVETLEPEAPDSFFNWNFFDGILMQKEYFSPYVFEDLAFEYLKENPGLLEKLNKKKAADEKFAASAYDQLLFIYQNSPWYEPTHKLYPVARVMDVKELSEIKN